MKFPEIGAEDSLRGQFKEYEKEKKEKESLKGMSPEKLKKVIIKYGEIMGMNDPKIDINTIEKRKAMSKRRFALGELGNEGLDMIEEEMKTKNGKIIAFSDLEVIIARLEDSLDLGKHNEKKQLQLETLLLRAKKILDKLTAEYEAENKEEAA